jgi:hypothetical protein
MRTYFTRRVLLGIGGGIAIGISATLLLERETLAVVLASVAAVAVADVAKAKQYVIVGFVTGAAVGLFIGVWGDHFLVASALPAGPLGVLVDLSGAVIVSGLIAAAYGFVTGEVKRLADEGRMPFF